MGAEADYLIVEDGSGVAGANSWLTVAQADAYHLARGNSAWAALTEAAKVASLIYATAWLATRVRWSGYYERGRLPFPALSAYDADGRLISGVPEEAKQAQAELALEHSSSPLNVVEPRQLVSLRVDVISLEWSEPPSGVSRALVSSLVSAISGVSHDSVVRPFSIGLW